MLEVKARAYMGIGQVMAQIPTIFDGGMWSSVLKIPQAQLEWLRNTLPALAAHCDQLQLATTKRQIQKFAVAYREEVPTWQQALMGLNAIQSCFEAELEERLFLFVGPQKASVYVSRSVGGAHRHPKIATQFPSALTELDEGSRCFAFEQNTACVFHSMRALELGLHAFAHHLNLQFAAPVEPQNWQNLIEKIEAEIRSLQKLPKGTAKDQELRFCSGSAAQFRYFKDAWRNHVAHSRASCTDAQALQILMHTIEFLNSLAEGGLAEPATTTT